MRFVLVSKWLCRVRKKKIKQANMDLNELPSAEFDYDFLQESDGNPTYCTQTTAVHNIEPSPNQQNPVVINGAAADDVNLRAAGNNLTEDVPTNSQHVEVVEEIWSTPPVSYTGQMFDTKQEAWAFYNSYANRIGFSIRTDTSRLSGSSGRSSLFVTKKGMAERKMRACQLLNLMTVRWGPVKLGYSLNSLEGNALFLQDFKNEKQKLNYKN